MKRFLAAICSCCPFCIARRAWPQSFFGKFMAKIERCCPFCKAYDDIHASCEKET